MIWFIQELFCFCLFAPLPNESSSVSIRGRSSWLNAVQLWKMLNLETHDVFFLGPSSHLLHNSCEQTCCFSWRDVFSGSGLSLMERFADFFFFFSHFLPSSAAVSCWLCVLTGRKPLGQMTQPALLIFSFLPFFFLLPLWDLRGPPFSHLFSFVYKSFLTSRCGADLRAFAYLCSRPLWIVFFFFFLLIRAGRPCQSAADSLLHRHSALLRGSTSAGGSHRTAGVGGNWDAVCGFFGGELSSAMKKTFRSLMVLLSFLTIVQ